MRLAGAGLVLWVSGARAEPPSFYFGLWRSVEGGNCDRESPDGPFAFSAAGASNYHVSCRVPPKAEPDGGISYTGRCRLAEGGTVQMTVTVRAISAARSLVQIRREGRLARPFEVTRCGR